MIRWILLWLVFFVPVGGLSAATYSASSSRSSATITVNEATLEASYTFSTSRSGSGSGDWFGYARIEKASAEGNPNHIGLVVGIGGGAGYNDSKSGTITLERGQWYILRATAHLIGPNTEMDGQRVWFFIGDQPQTIYVSPSGPTIGPVVRGSQIIFTASGGYNDYEWELTALSPETGGIITLGGTNKAQALITFSDLGQYTVTVYNKAGNGYEQSNTVSVTVLTVGAHKFTVPLQNTADHPVKFRIYQGATLIDEVVLAGGASATMTYELPDATPLRVATVDEHLEKVGPIWMPPDDLTPVPDENDVAEVPPNTTGPTNPITPPPTPNTQPVSGTGQSVWESVTKDNKDNPVTAIQNAEGVGKIVGAVSEASEHLKPGTAEGHGLDLSDVPAHEESVTRERVNDLIGMRPEMGNFIPPASASSMVFNVDMIAGEGMQTQAFGFTFDFSDWITRLSWLREFIHAIMTVFLFFAIQKQLRDSVAN